MAPHADFHGRRRKLACGPPALALAAGHYQKRGPHRRGGDGAQVNPPHQGCSAARCRHAGSPASGHTSTQLFGSCLKVWQLSLTRFIKLSQLNLSVIAGHVAALPRPRSAGVPISQQKAEQSGEPMVDLSSLSVPSLTFAGHAALSPPRAHTCGYKSLCLPLLHIPTSCLDALYLVQSCCHTKPSYITNWHLQDCWAQQCARPLGASACLPCSPFRCSPSPVGEWRSCASAGYPVCWGAGGLCHGYSARHLPKYN